MHHHLGGRADAGIGVIGGFGAIGAVGKRAVIGGHPIHETDRCHTADAGQPIGVEHSPLRQHVRPCSAHHSDVTDRIGGVNCGEGDQDRPFARGVVKDDLPGGGTGDQRPAFKFQRAFAGIGQQIPTSHTQSIGGKIGQDQRRNSRQVGRQRCGPAIWRQNARPRQIIIGPAAPLPRQMPHPRPGGFHDVQKGLLYRPIVDPGEAKRKMRVSHLGKAGENGVCWGRVRRGCGRDGWCGLWIRGGWVCGSIRRHPLGRHVGLQTFPRDALQCLGLRVGDHRIARCPCPRQFGGQALRAALGNHACMHHRKEIQALAVGVKIIGEYILNLCQPRNCPFADFVRQVAHRLPCRDQFDLMARQGGSLRDRALPQWQIECQTFAPRDACPLIACNHRAGGRFQTGPGFIQIHAGVGVGRHGKPCEFGDVFGCVRPRNIRCKRLGFGQDQDIGAAICQPCAGINAFSLCRMIPVIRQRCAIDDLRLRL